MENASKALIIAGAILLAILLISLGILIFNQAQDTVNNSGMSQAEITAFNNKFIKYEGKQKGSVVKSMVNEVFTSNADANNSSRKITIDFEYRDTAGTPQKTSGLTTTQGIQTTKNYNVTLEYNNQGVVNKIIIKE